MQQVGDLARALDEHVEIAAGGVVHVLPRLERHLVEPHPRQPLEQRARVVGEIAREPLQCRRVRRRGRVHAPHPLHVLARQRDDEIGVVDLLHGRLPAPVVGDLEADAT